MSSYLYWASRSPGRETRKISWESQSSHVPEHGLSGFPPAEGMQLLPTTPRHTGPRSDPPHWQPAWPPLPERGHELVPGHFPHSSAVTLLSPGPGWTLGHRDQFLPMMTYSPVSYSNINWHKFIEHLLETRHQTTCILSKQTWSQSLMTSVPMLPMRRRR